MRTQHADKGLTGGRAKVSWMTKVKRGNGSLVQLVQVRATLASINKPLATLLFHALVMFGRLPQLLVQVRIDRVPIQKAINVVNTGQTVVLPGPKRVVDAQLLIIISQIANIFDNYVSVALEKVRQTKLSKIAAYHVVGWQSEGSEVHTKPKFAGVPHAGRSFGKKKD